MEGLRIIIICLLVWNLALTGTVIGLIKKSNNHGTQIETVAKEVWQLEPITEGEWK